MHFKVVGTPPNIQLVRMDGQGKTTTARPGSPEELFMYKAIQSLRREKELLEASVERAEAKLDVLLRFATTLADYPEEKRREVADSLWAAQQQAEADELMEGKSA